MKSQAELKTISTIIDNLNYYQVLKVSPVASIEEIREAFHREALDFHPDQYAKPELKKEAALAKKIYSKIIQAYQALTQPSGRTSYDKKMLRKKLLEEPTDEKVDENEITGIQSNETKKANFPGRKFYELAQKALLAKNMNAAKMNIQIALGAEPTNRQYKELQKRILRSKGSG